MLTIRQRKAVEKAHLSVSRKIRFGPYDTRFNLLFTVATIISVNSWGMNFNGIVAEDGGVYTAFAVANKTLLPALSAYSFERCQRTVEVLMRKISFGDRHSHFFY